MTIVNSFLGKAPIYISRFIAQKLQSDPQSLKKKRKGLFVIIYCQFSTIFNHFRRLQRPTNSATNRRSISIFPEEKSKSSFSEKASKGNKN